MLKSICQLKSNFLPLKGKLFSLSLCLLLCFFSLHNKKRFFHFSLCWRYQHTQKEPCPGNSPKISRALFPTVHSAPPGRQQILIDAQPRVPRGMGPSGLWLFLFHSFRKTCCPRFSSYQSVCTLQFLAVTNPNSSVYLHAQRCCGVHSRDSAARYAANVNQCLCCTKAKIKASIVFL